MDRELENAKQEVQRAKEARRRREEVSMERDAMRGRAERLRRIRAQVEGTLLPPLMPLLLLLPPLLLPLPLPLLLLLLLLLLLPPSEGDCGSAGNAHEAVRSLPTSRQRLCRCSVIKAAPPSALPPALPPAPVPAPVSAPATTPVGMWRLMPRQSWPPVSRAP